MVEARFEVDFSDPKCLARNGRFHLPERTVPTPVLWFGESLRSSLHVSSAFADFPVPVVVSYGDVAHRPRLRERSVRLGIHDFLGASGPVLGDSGGYKWSKGVGAHVEFAQVLDFYENAGISLGAVLDFPPVQEVGEDRNQVRWNATMLNLAAMSAAARQVQIIPVLHAYSLERLSEACDDVASVVTCPPIIALGGFVPLLKARRVKGAARTAQQTYEFVADAIVLVRERFPTSMIHVFGAGSATTAIPLFALGVDSVDSAGWRHKAAFGAIVLRGTGDRFPGPPRGSRRRPPIGDRERALLKKCRCQVCVTGRTVEEKLLVLASCFRSRALHNAHTMMQDVTYFRAALADGRGLDYCLNSLSPKNRLRPTLIRRFSP